jgi:acyl-CoA thioesterase-1
MILRRLSLRSLTYGARGAVRKLAVAAALAGALAPAPAPAAAGITLAALGDSLTQGYGLPPEDGLVPRLQAWLRARGHEVTVLNAGVSGDTTAGGRSRVAWTLEGGADAMMVALGGNDLLRGIDPAASRANLDAILAEAGARDVPVLLVGISAPGNYGPDYKAAFDAMFPELAAAHGALYHPGFFTAFAGAGADDPAAMRRFMQPDGLHPSAEGVARIVEEIGPAVEDLLARATERATAQTPR